MKDFVVYHKPEIMGYEAIDVDRLAIYTNKTAAGVVGGRIWLMTGEGTPRTYKLRAVFIAQKVERSDKPTFKTRVSGKEGHLFHPMPAVGRESWFPSFKRSQGNFSLGLARITVPDAIAGLERILKAHK